MNRIHLQSIALIACLGLTPFSSQTLAECSCEGLNDRPSMNQPPKPPNDQVPEECSIDGEPSWVTPQWRLIGVKLKVKIGTCWHRFSKDDPSGELDIEGRPRQKWYIERCDCVGDVYYYTRLAQIALKDGPGGHPCNQESMFFDVTEPRTSNAAPENCSVKDWEPPTMV